MKIKSELLLNKTNLPLFGGCSFASCEFPQDRFTQFQVTCNAFIQDRRTSPKVIFIAIFFNKVHVSQLINQNFRFLNICLRKDIQFKAGTQSETPPTNCDFWQVLCITSKECNLVITINRKIFFQHLLTTNDLKYGASDSRLNHETIIQETKFLLEKPSM